MDNVQNCDSYVLNLFLTIRKLIFPYTQLQQQCRTRKVYRIEAANV
jgi:hypothetical protein